MNWSQTGWSHSTLDRLAVQINGTLGLDGDLNLSTVVNILYI